MYQMLTIKDEIPVRPEKFNLDIEKAVKESLSERYEGMIDTDNGVMLVVKDVEEIGEGKVLPGDPAVHYTVRFTVLSWAPKMQEVIEGSVVDITEWGAFLRIGPIDGLVHVSQVMDDFVSYDEKNQQLTGKSSKRVLKVGDKCRARIIAISLKEQNKIGLTMRQPFLGNINWISAERKVEEKVEKPKKESKKEKK